MKKKLVFVLLLATILCGCQSAFAGSGSIASEVSAMYEEMAAYEPTIVIYQVKEGKISGELGEEIAKAAFEAIGVDFETVAKLSDEEEIYKTRENCYRASDTSVAFKVASADQMPALMDHLYHRADYGSVRLLEYGVYPNEMTKDELQVYVTASVAAEQHVPGEVCINPLNENVTPAEGLEVVCKVLETFGVAAQTVKDEAANAKVESNGTRRTAKTECYTMVYEVAEDGSEKLVSLTVHVAEKNLAEAILVAWNLPEVKSAWMNELKIVE